MVPQDELFFGSTDDDGGLNLSPPVTTIHTITWLGVSSSSTVMQIVCLRLDLLVALYLLVLVTGC